MLTIKILLALSTQQDVIQPQAKMILALIEQDYNSNKVIK